jgi:hypothetical protein
MRARRAVGGREASGWGAFLAVVIVLRLAGIGTPPPEVHAASAGGGGAEEVDPTAARVARELGSIVADLDVSTFEPATRRCLEAGLRCTAKDVLDVDTTRIRLAALAAGLGQALDPADPGYLGGTDASTSRQAGATRDAAGSAADALAAFLSGGCAGSVDGVAVDQAPATCDELVTGARRSLSSFTAAVGDWSAGPT